MTVNDPEIVHTLARLHDTYEAALVANDIAALNAFFWDSSHVVRYGVAEQLYGTDELHTYRAGSTPPYTERRIVRREISTFDSNFASIMTEIEMVIDGGRRSSRQSQTWVRVPTLGWRIVSAHVSVPLPAARAGSPWGSYADAMSRTLRLPVADAHRAGVVANLERTAGIVGSLLAFPLSDEAEGASVFKA